MSNRTLKPRRRFPPLIEQDTTKALRRATKQHVEVEPGTRIFRFGHGSVFLSRHPETNDWHMSISYPNRYPEWDEIVAVRYALIPHDVMMALALPPLDMYVNHNPNLLQLYQAPQEWADNDLPPEMITPPTALTDYYPIKVRELEKKDAEPE